MNISEIIILGVSCIGSFVLGYKVSLYICIQSLNRVRKELASLEDVFKRKESDHETEIQIIKFENEVLIDKLMSARPSKYQNKEKELKE